MASNVSGSGNAPAIWNELAGYGLDKNVVAGIMGNLQQESSLNPNEAGGGLAQWGGSRLTALNQYAAMHGLSPNSIKAQVGYLMKELQSGSEGITPAKLNGMSAAQVAQLFSDKFERPAAWAADNDKRQNYANQFLSKYGK